MKKGRHIRPLKRGLLPSIHHERSDMIVEMEMSLSLKELRRQLKALSGFSAETETLTACTWRIGGARLHITPLPPRRIGALTLPRLALRLDLSALAPEDRREFLDRFRRLTFRGGG